MDGQEDHGGSVAIIGMACRFPGASDPAGFHRRTVAAQPRFGLVTAWPGGELHAALVDDWAAAPASLGEAGPGAEDAGPVRKLAAEMTALALSDAGLREAAGSSRTGLVIASSVPELSGLVAGELGFAAYVPYSQAASLSSLHAVAAAAQAVAAGDLDLAVAGGAELGLDPVLARAAGASRAAGHQPDARLRGRPGLPAARGWLRHRGPGAPGRRPRGGPARVRGDRGLDRGARRPAGLPASRRRSGRHSAHRGPGHRHRRRRPGRAERVHPAAARRGDRCGARRRLGRPRLHQGGGGHRQPDQDDPGDGRGDDPGRHRVRPAAPADRGGRRPAQAACAAGTMAGRNAGRRADPARGGQLARHRRGACAAQPDRRAGASRGPSRAAARPRAGRPGRPTAARDRRGGRAIPVRRRRTTGRGIPAWHRGATERATATWHRGTTERATPTWHRGATERATPAR